MRDKQQLRLLGKLLRYTIVSYNFNSSTARSPFTVGKQAGSLDQPWILENTSYITLINCSTKKLD